jgi:hypothetical protein
VVPGSWFSITILFDWLAGCEQAAINKDISDKKERYFIDK